MPNNLEMLALRVEADIKRRGLTSGDRYLTGEEVGRMLNVSSISANRAMQMLAEKGLLVRQRKAGTFIGDAVQLPAAATRKRVHLVLNTGIWPDDRLAGTTYVNQLLCGILDVMPDCSVQTDIVGPSEIKGFARRIISTYMDTADVAGVVLVRSSPETQRQLAEAGVPTAIFGSVFPGVGSLARVDVDQAEIGRLSIDYLNRAKHKRAVMLMVNPWLSGDNRFIAGMMEACQAHSGGCLLEIQSVPADDTVCYGVVESVLTGPDRPDAILARSAWVAHKVNEVAGALGLRIPDDVDLIIGNHHEVEIEGRRLPGCRSVKSVLECGRSLGRMLIAINQHRTLDEHQEIVPVEFVER